MKTQFEPGDVVRVRSGSPDMTVTDVKATDGAVDVLLLWFDGSAFKSETLPAEGLMYLPDHPGNAK